MDALTLERTPTLKRGRGLIKPERLVIPPPEVVVIKPPNLQYGQLLITGTAPLVTCAFSQKAQETIIATQIAGSQSRKGKKREPKNFDEVFEGSKHISREGWLGFVASAIRAASVSACRLCGFKMTLAKLSIFVEADGFDRVSGQPLVRIIGDPIRHTMHARPQTGGMDIRVRPMWKEGWQAILRMKWDADQFSAADVVNLIARVGAQVGIGEGRPDSRDSCGLGWGLFSVESMEKDSEGSDQSRTARHQRRKSRRAATR